MDLFFVSIGGQGFLPMLKIFGSRKFFAGKKQPKITEERIFTGQVLPAPILEPMLTGWCTNGI